MNLSAIPTPALAGELISRPDGPAECSRVLISRRNYTKALKPCPHCEMEFGARDLRKHIPICPLKPRRTASIAPVSA